MKTIDKRFDRFLTDDQKEKYASLIWLLAPGPRRAGRSFLMAMAFIEISIKYNMPVHVFDHCKSPDSYRRCVSKIRSIIHDMNIIIRGTDGEPGYELLVNETNKSITVRKIENAYWQENPWL